MSLMRKLGTDFTKMSVATGQGVLALNSEGRFELDIKRNSFESGETLAHVVQKGVRFPVLETFQVRFD